MGPATDFQRAGLYTAYFLNMPWHGDEVQPTAESFLKSGARLVVVTRGETENFNPLARSLAEHPGFRNLDSVLFASPDEAKEFPLAVFEIQRSK
jgi:membrane-associated protease RseP (regulator of RpoE activity)